MGRMPVPDRLSALPGGGCPPPGLWGIIRRFHRLSPCRGLVAYALRTRAPLSRPIAGTLTVRLACIRPAASVHPEPGSNSSLYIVTLDSFPVHRIHLGPKLMVDFLTFQTFYAWLIASKNCRNRIPTCRPLSLSVAGAKIQPFTSPPTLF